MCNKEIKNQENKIKNTKKVYNSRDEFLKDHCPFTDDEIVEMTLLEEELEK